jgi:membrane-associated phospholipid phosphatase
MLKIIEKNNLFFALYFVCFFTVFFQELNKPMLEATFFFGAHRTAFGDEFFKFWTLLGEAFPYLFLTLFFVFYKKDRKSIFKIALIGASVLIISVILKEIFETPRPTLVLENMGLATSFQFVEGIELLRGETSFPSGHTASAFALWGWAAFQFPRIKVLQIVFFLTAFLVGVSRVYLTQHFPQDTLFGSAIGLSIAVLVEYFLGSRQL